MKNFIYLILTVLYVVSPIDIVPDAIPIAGQADDLLAILLQARRMYKSISGQLYGWRFETMGLTDILMKIVDSAVQSSARTIDRSMKNGNFSEAQRERMREQRDSLKEMHKQYEKTKKEEAWAKEEEERNNY